MFWCCSSILIAVSLLFVADGSDYDEDEDL